MAGEEEERQLIRRSQGGDLAAFDVLVRRYEKPVYSLAYRLAGSYDEASDIAQEAFVRAWKNLKSFRGDASFATWLYRIVTNAFFDTRKRSHARPHRSLEEVLALEETAVTRQFEDTGPTLQERAEGRERRELLERAVAALPESQRTLVVLYHMHDRSYEQIAQILSLPIGTVKSRLSRARLALRDKLAPIAELFGASESPK